MKISSSISFKGGIVTVVPENYGKDIKHNIQNRNKINIYSKNNAQNISDDINYFIVAGGKGTRLSPITNLQNKNKICFEFPMKNMGYMNMIDFPMALGQNFIPSHGYKVIESEKAAGNIAGVIRYYLENPNEIKDTIISGGDLVYNITSKELTDYILYLKKHPNTHLALLGTEKTPQEVDKKFGIMNINMIDDNIGNLVGFIEKPCLEVAKMYTNKKGKNIVNTGLTFISEKAMKEVINPIRKEYEKQGEAYFEKEENRKMFHGASLIEHLLQNYNKLFNCDYQENIKVKMVKKWDDVGTVNSYKDFIKDIANGFYLKNFNNKFKEDLQQSAKDRIKTINNQDYLLISKNYNSFDELPENKIKEAKQIENIKVID